MNIDNNQLAVRQDIPLSDIEKMADYVVKSGLFSMRSKEQALALMLICQSENMHPMRAVQIFDIIQGKACPKSNAILARHQQSGGTIKWIESTDIAAEAEVSHPSGGTISVRWTMEDAKRAGLCDKENYKKYPRQMLRARVAAEGVRAVNPGCLFGMYVPEEIQESEVVRENNRVMTKIEAPQAAAADPAVAAKPVNPDQNHELLQKTLSELMEESGIQQLWVERFLCDKGLMGVDADLKKITTRQLSRLVKHWNQVVEWKKQFDGSVVNDGKAQQTITW